MPPERAGGPKAPWDRVPSGRRSHGKEGVLPGPLLAHSASPRQAPGRRTGDSLPPRPSTGLRGDRRGPVTPLAPRCALLRTLPPAPSAPGGGQAGTRPARTQVARAREGGPAGGVWVPVRVRVSRANSARPPVLGACSRRSTKAVRSDLTSNPRSSGADATSCSSPLS